MAATTPPPDFRQFAQLRSDVEAVIQRIGRNTWDCVLIDVDGNWTRGVFPSKEVATAVCTDLGVRFHEGWDARMNQRMNRRDHWGEPGGQQRAVWPQGARPLRAPGSSPS
ncbi:MAG TPA: hypothetical protein VE754_03255 [Actinomycetota bacterium]|jgi:hypothetical protein|nr:hypothetical protein [Actinomycetota bacterium]